MAKYRHQLPQLTGKMFLTDGGIETTLIFHEGLDLPHFAAFDLLKDAAGNEALQKYFRTYAALARKYEVGFILESATWRANPDWAAKLGYSDEQLAALNRKAIESLCTIRAEYENEKSPMVISGCVGPRGDGYIPSSVMSAGEAQRYHSMQIDTFSETQADLVTAITMNYAEEAIGIALAAQSAQIPVIISFTVETDGRLPTGQMLRNAIEAVDAATDDFPAYYMINCAHPRHFREVLMTGELWLRRIRGLRANASAKSHAELNDSTELDEGDPEDLGRHYSDLVRQLENLNVLGGCCGTDHRHVEEICKACLAVPRKEFLHVFPG
ncbi:MAG TPA: homocysteine S-methyltransferase family protein [Chthoniobacterales bacterium]